MRTRYQLRISANGAVRRVPLPVPVEDVGIARLVMTELDLGVALRVVLALLLYILKLRLDRQMLSPQRAQRIRADIMRLVQDLAASDPEAPAEVRHAAAEPIRIAESRPVLAPAPTTTPSVVKKLEFPVRKQATQPPPQPATVMEPVMLDGVSLDSLAQLSVAELREFTRVAARDTKPLFEQALLAAYRKQLIAIFCGPFSVKLETDDFNYPEFRLICRGAKTLVLKRGKPNGTNAIPDAYEMLREHWFAGRRPQHFRIEKEEGQLARQLLSCASDLQH